MKLVLALLLSVLALTVLPDVASAAPVVDAGGLDASGGLGSSPSGELASPAPLPPMPPMPAVPASTDWTAKMAFWLVAGLTLLKRAAPKWFASDGAGFFTSFAVGQLVVMAEAVLRHESLSWTLAKEAFVISVLASGGYTILYKRGLRPLLVKLFAWQGWSWPTKLLGEEAKA